MEFLNVAENQKIVHTLVLFDDATKIFDNKKNASCLFLFGGYSKMDFDSFFNQFRSPISKKELWNTYSGLSRRDVLLFNYCGDMVNVKVLNLS
jgi:hypothetical protein